MTVRLLPIVVASLLAVACSKNAAPKTGPSAPVVLPTKPNPASPDTPANPVDPPKDPGVLCRLACNKAQQCATGRGSVTACLDRCLTVMKGAEPDEVLEARGFAGQASCHEADCSGFRACVTRVLVGTAAATHPAMTMDQAQPRCLKLCDKEVACQPDQTKQRPGGATACVDACLQVHVGEEATFAAQRAMMSRSLGCIDEPCDAFQACVKAALMKL